MSDEFDQDYKKNLLRECILASNEVEPLTDGKCLLRAINPYAA